MTDEARPVETELKLRLAPKDATRLLESAAARMNVALGPPATERLKTIYFDSPDRKLWQRVMPQAALHN